MPSDKNEPIIITGSRFVGEALLLRYSLDVFRIPRYAPINVRLLGRGGGGGRGVPGIGGGCELGSVFQFKCPALGKSS